MSLVHRAAFVVLLAALPVLAGCAPTEPAPSASPTDIAAPPVETPAPATVFTPPTSCDALTGPDLAAQFAAQDIVLFDSTDGQGIYAGGGVEVAQDGGDPFFCLFGKDMVDLSTFQLVVQPVSSEAEHEGIVAVLGSGGFDESLNGDTVTWVRVGDEGTTGSIVHVLRQDSWLSAASSFGGVAQVDALLGYLDEVANQVYGAP